MNMKCNVLSHGEYYHYALQIKILYLSTRRHGMTTQKTIILRYENLGKNVWFDKKA
jgi:hypothetical protein